MIGGDRVAHGAVAGVVSTNWSGYALSGGPYTSVVSSWVQPAVKCSGSNQYAAFWDGLDGYGDDTVEQTGSMGYCTTSGSRHSRTFAPVYYAWYEMYPAAMVEFLKPVKPGDQITASVTGSSNGNFTLVLSDARQKWTETVNETLPNPALSSAEVVAEAPSSGSVLPLADFGTVTFTGALVNGQAMASSPGGQLSEITMKSVSGALEAQPGPITGTGSAGSSFSDVWESL
jgi:hypothetical protein